MKPMLQYVCYALKLIYFTSRYRWAVEKLDYLP